jgi:hypothetical protein
MSEEKKEQKTKRAERKAEEILKGARIDPDVVRYASNPPEKRNEEESK